MSDQDTRDLETDDELRARLRAFAQQVKERTDTEAALQRMPRQSRPRTLGRLAIAACFVAAVAVATVVLVERRSGDTIDTSEATAASAPTTTLAKEAPPRFIPLPPEGAAPSAPVEGVLLLSLQACSGPSSLPWSGILALYADGRLLWHTYDDPIEGDPSSWERSTPEDCVARAASHARRHRAAALRARVQRAARPCPWQPYTLLPRRLIPRGRPNRRPLRVLRGKAPARPRRADRRAGVVAASQRLGGP